jgi:hypothetical protein
VIDERISPAITYSYVMKTVLRRAPGSGPSRADAGCRVSEATVGSADQSAQHRGAHASGIILFEATKKAKPLLYLRSENECHFLLDADTGEELRKIDFAHGQAALARGL